MPSSWHSGAASLVVSSSHPIQSSGFAMVLPNVYNVGYSAGQAVRAVLDHHADLPSLPEAWELILSFPVIYKNWWWNLVTNDPFHVLVETTLIAFCIYMIIISRSKDYRSERKERLSKKEEEELLREWREEERDGLAPETLPAQNFMIVHAMNGRTMKIQKKSSPKDDTMDVLNFATNDFLGMSGNEQVKEASRLALNKYGCGSCGPRGFYGTIDVHLDLEQAIADFIGTEGAIMYSDGASTVSSTVAAFAKRGDLLVVDDGIYEPLVTGVTLSRANLFWFRHNDMVR
jgi:serine palmitoyltransferase